MNEHSNEFIKLFKSLDLIEKIKNFNYVTRLPVSEIRSVAGPMEIQRRWMYTDPAPLDMNRYSSWKYTDRRKRIDIKT